MNTISPHPVPIFSLATCHEWRTEIKVLGLYNRSVVIGLLQLLHICTVYFKDQLQSVDRKLWTDVAYRPRLRSTLSPPLPS